MGVVMVLWTFRFSNSLTESYFQIQKEVTNMAIVKELNGVEIAVANDAADVGRHLQSPQSVTDNLAANLQTVPKYTGVLGYFVAFEPDYFPNQGRWFEPYAWYHNGSIMKAQVGSEKHDYHNREWYKKGMLTDEGYWSQPYPSDAGHGLPLCSFVKPLIDEKGNKVGLFGADVSLGWLHQWLKDKDLTTNEKGLAKLNRRYKGHKNKWTYSFIITNNGVFIAHPDSARILKDNFFTQFSETTDTAALRMVSDMRAGIDGMAQTTIDNTDVKVYYSRLEHTDWMMAIVVPQWVYTAMGVTASVVLGSIIIIGLFLIYLSCSYIVRRTAKPMLLLSESAREVAKGNFNASLPDLPDNDELRQLRDSFEHMQHSLSLYVEQLKHTTAEKAVMEKELNIARNIQIAMTYKTYPPFPEHKEIDIYGLMVPAKSVGGDLFDFLVKDDRLFFCIGDVSGKSIPAALVMTVTLSLFHSIASQETQPNRIMTRINSLMCENNKTGMFVTLFIGILNLKNGHLDFCNAAHEPPLIIKQNYDWLQLIPNLPVGIMPDRVFYGQSIRLDNNSMMLLYTDGLTEAMNEQKQLFERNRIVEMATRNKSDELCTSQQMVELMREAVDAFVGDASQNDDLTMLCIKYQREQSDSDKENDIPDRQNQTCVDLEIDSKEYSHMKDFVLTVTDMAGMNEESAKKLRLAVEEAVANVFNYSGATMLTMNSWQDNGSLYVSMADDGCPFDPTAAAEPNFDFEDEMRAPGGLGIFCIRQMTDSMTYERKDGKNILTISKTI